MLKKIIIVLIIFLYTGFVFAQQNSGIYPSFENSVETYFRFRIPQGKNIQDITRIISIENSRDGYIYAYANREQFRNFQKLGIDYELLQPNYLKVQYPMCKSLEKLYAWNTYPTYFQYDSIMHKFENDHPGICKLVNFGSSVKGRSLFVLHISDDINVKKNKPEFFYSSTMHGNEPIGYVLMLRFINYLLSGYGTNPQIDSLIGKFDIWINPLANPDGTYALNDSTINNSTRYNANGVDLNRNFPNQEFGNNPDGYQWQPENVCYDEFYETT